MCLYMARGILYPFVTCVCSWIAANVWKEHFQDILNSVTSETNKAIVHDNIQHIHNEDHIMISPELVSDAINKLKTGKSCGNDGLTSEHFKYSDNRLSIYCQYFLPLLSLMVIYPILL